MKHFFSNENGHVIVEATIVFPAAILMVIALFYAAIFLCQRANLQANLNNALIYYKNIQSDSFIGQPSTDMAYKVSTKTEIKGTQFERNPKTKFPYRSIFFSGELKDSDKFKSFFRSMMGTMFFDTGENVEVTLKTRNLIIYKEISATAKQVITPAISFELIGIDGAMTIEADASMVISDGDSFVSNIDFVTKLIMDSKWGDKIQGFTERIGELYEKFKDLFHLD